MDSFFKAAVCDLDKLLDDFELSAEEAVFLKPSAYPFSSLGSQYLSLEVSEPPSLPDLSSLHYGSAASCPDRPGGHRCSTEDREVRGQPLTGVDLLSSVDRRPALSSAPPCPDRALKPVCDLVNDTSSAMLGRASGHDAFSELDLVEKQMEEEEALLVDLDSPVVEAEQQGAGLCQSGAAAEERASAANGGAPGLGAAASLSLLDVILPAAVERCSEATDDDDDDSPSLQASVDRGGRPCDKAGCPDGVLSLAETPVTAKEDESQEASEMGEAESPGSSDSDQVGLSCLPLAVSICGALARQEPREEASVRESAGTGSLDAQEDMSLEPAAAIPHLPAGRASSDGAEPSPVDPAEFGFEYLPESDQAELLVTDEELDAFLLAHAEAERAGGARPESPSEPGKGGVEEELRSCGRARREELEALASPESDRIMCAPAEAPSWDVCRPGPGDPELSSAAETSQSQLGSSPDRRPSCAGARPKQLNCQRPPPAGEEEEEEEEEWKEPSTAAEDEERSPVSPGLTGRRSALQHWDHGEGCDELSEPPPYPGEPPTDGAGAAQWKREGQGEEELELGSRQPAWVPDSEAPNCMKCSQRFTFTRRRHHCRACGKVYCAVCCNRKCKLKYLEKEARVCVVCFDAIHRAQALERMMSPTGPSPNPNVPSEYCSTIPPLQQARAAGTLNSPPPTVMVPVSVLKHPSSDGCPREQKRVWFADGILPNGEVADTARLSGTGRRSSQELAGVTPDETASTFQPGPAGLEVGVSGSSSCPESSGAAEGVRPLVSGPWDYGLLSAIGSSVRRVPSLLPEDEDALPPLLFTTGEEDAGGGGGDVLVEESPAPCQILHLLEEGGPRPLTFVLNANLLVNVKLVTHSSRRCWCFGSNGLRSLGQKELVFLLECLPEEKTLPKDLFALYLTVYRDAQRGKFVDELDNVTFTSSFLGSKDHAAMLFFSPTCQPLDGLSLPARPFLFGLLVQKLEVPWAKVFPLRLLLRLGAKYSAYPTMLACVRFRDPVYQETGHTIMNLLADLRNYQYSLSVVDGLRIHMEMGHSFIDIPKSSFSEVQKVINASNEHVISIGATFSTEADSHLVCVQSEEGGYQTQASSAPGRTRTVTGASFVVFNGALKASSGFIAKSSIVEDGLMVQIPPETMEALRSALREQADFHIPCGRSDGGEIRENVTVRWVDWSSPVNAGKTSGVDARPLDGVRSVRMQQDADFESDGRAIKCTEVFYQLKSPDRGVSSPPASCAVFQMDLAAAACGALAPHLAVLSSGGINSIALRVSTQADVVEYQAGSGGTLLPQRYMNELDGALIPVIHGGGASVPQTAMDMEFVFFITHTL